MEQVRLLGHDADDLAERGELDPPDIDAIDLDRPGVDVVQARDEVRRRRLAAARWADERHELARLGLEIDRIRARTSGASRSPADRRRAVASPRPRSDEALDRRLVDLGRRDRGRGLLGSSGPPRRRRVHRPLAGNRLGRVAERHVAEADLAADGGGGEGHGIGCVDDLGVHLEVFEDAVEQGERTLDLDLDAEQLAEREEQPALQRRERDDVADRRCGRVVLDGQPAGQPVHERRA